MQQSRRGVAQALDEKRHQLGGVAEGEPERFGTPVVVPHAEVDEAAVEMPGSAKNSSLVIDEQDAAGRKFVHLSDAHGLILDLRRILSR